MPVPKHPSNEDITFFSSLVLILSMTCGKENKFGGSDESAFSSLEVMWLNNLVGTLSFQIIHTSKPILETIL